VTVEHLIGIREVPLPKIGEHKAIGCEFVTPGIFRTVKTATRSEFPFCFCRQRFTRPLGIGERIGIGNLHHGVIL